MIYFCFHYCPAALPRALISPHPAEHHVPSFGSTWCPSVGCKLCWVKDCVFTLCSTTTSPSWVSSAVKALWPLSRKVGHERIPSCVQREENKVTGQRVKVNKKILFSYTCGMFLAQIKHPTCRRKTVQKYHTEEIWMVCHHWGVTRQVPLEAQTVLPTLNRMAG